MPKRGSGPWIPLGIGAVIAVVLVLVLRATGSPVFTDPVPTPAPAPSTPVVAQPSTGLSPPATGACADPAAPSTTSPAPEPTPEPEPPRTYPRADAGVVAPGAPAQISGTGNTEVDYQRAGNIVTAYEFDCPDCKSGIRLYDRARGQELISLDSEPFADAWLLDRPMGNLPLTNSMVIEADGHWTLTVRHGADVPAAQDVESGRGPAMLNIPDGSTRRLTFSPYDEKDAMRYYAVDLGDGDTAQIDCSEGGTVEIENNGKPYLLLLSTYGDWKLHRR